MREAPGGDADLRAIDAALGAWTGRHVDGATYADSLRSGGRLRDQDTA